MLRLIVKQADGYINIAADRMEVADCMIYAYAGETLVGLFDIGTVLTAYLSYKG